MVMSRLLWFTVDDLLIAGVSDPVIDHVVQSIQKEFEIKDLGDVSTFLGIEVEKDAVGDFYVSQGNNIKKIVEEAGLVNAKISKVPLDPGYAKLESSEQIPDHEYRKLIGMLLYVSINSRPDITASVSILSQRMSSPTKVDMK